MRGLLVIVILAAGSMLSLPLQAQRGGMGGGRGGMAGGRGGAVGHGPVAVPRGRVGPGIPGGRFGGVPSASRVVANNGRFVNGRFGNNNHTVFVNGRRHCFGGFNCRNRFFFNNGFGFGFPGFGFGFPYYGYIPGFYPSDYFQDSQPQQPVVASNENEGNMQLAVEIQRLSDEISYMREQQTRQPQARQSADPPSGDSPSTHSAQLTVFVFRDGHGISTENYAIAGQTLWVFNERVAKKYPISELDRATTQQVNATNGVEIRLPEPEP